MAGGRRLIVALALAIPLLVVGTGLAMGATFAPDTVADEKPTAPADILVPVATSPAAPGYGDCIRDCDAQCDQECVRQCLRDGECINGGECIREGECINAGSCNGPCGAAVAESQATRGNGCARSCGRAV